MQNRNRKPSNTSSSISNMSTPKKTEMDIKLLAIVTLFIIFVIGGICVYFKTIKAMEFTPRKLFEQAFVESPDEVSELNGESNPSIGFDHWIRFKSLSEVHLRQAQDFKPYLSETGRISFAEHYPDDPILRQVARNYKYFVRTESTVGKRTNEGLLINTNNHAYYYHSCGI